MFSQEGAYNAWVASLLNDDGIQSEIVGYIMLALNKRENYSFIQGLFVEEKYRHRGIAKRLVNEAENYSRSIGCIDIKAESRPHLLRFYNKLGFSTYKGISETKYIIFKNLGRDKEIRKDDEWER